MAPLLLRKGGMYVEIHSRDDYQPKSKGRTQKVAAQSFMVNTVGGLLTVKAGEWETSGANRSDFETLAGSFPNDTSYERTAVLEFQPQDLAKIFNVALAAGLIILSALPLCAG